MSNEEEVKQRSAADTASAMGFAAPVTSAGPAVAEGFGQAHGAGLPANVAEAQARSIQEVQAKMVIAQKFPRAPIAAMTRILQSCRRPKLAESAFYAFKRGNELVSGETIRLMEVIAQQWGNLDYGAREVERHPATAHESGRSMVETWAWDLETNTRASISFEVPHIRYTRKGVYDVEDPRDIYELVMNQASRRMRSCLERVIPSDVIEAAADECRKTEAGQSSEPLADRIRHMAAYYEKEHGVTTKQLEGLLGHNLDATVETEMLKLKALARSLREGFTNVEEVFGMPGQRDAQAKVADLESVLEQAGKAVKESGAQGIRHTPVDAVVMTDERQAAPPQAEAAAPEPEKQAVTEPEAAPQAEEPPEREPGADDEDEEEEPPPASEAEQGVRDFFDEWDQEEAKK